MTNPPWPPPDLKAGADAFKRLPPPADFDSGFHAFDRVQVPTPPAAPPPDDDVIDTILSGGPTRAWAALAWANLLRRFF